MKTMLTVLGAALLGSVMVSPAAEPDGRCFELRIYYAAPGKLSDLQARFRDHTVALFEKHGIANLGYWVPQENTDNKLIYIVAFPSKEARAESWKAFGADPDWKAVVKTTEANGRLVTKVDSIIMSATDYSPPVKPSIAPNPRCFELRTYTASPGNLKNLNARFRDHTLALFKKHGLNSFAYWTPTDPKQGADNTLIYILAHPSKEAATQSWQEFRDDANWIAAKKASEVNGSLTTKVESVYMTPTDFSPTR
jgi:hypothetical protein